MTGKKCTFMSLPTGLGRPTAQACHPGPHSLQPRAGRAGLRQGYWDVRGAHPGAAGRWGGLPRGGSAVWAVNLPSARSADPALSFPGTYLSSRWRSSGYVQGRVPGMLTRKADTTLILVHATTW